MVYGYSRPTAWALRSIQPNPVIGKTSVLYDVPSGERVSLRVFDVTGRLVRCLVDRRHSAGAHAVEWDGRSDAGTKVSSGAYFLQMKAGDFIARVKVVVLE